MNCLKTVRGVGASEVTNSDSDDSEEEEEQGGINTVLVVSGVSTKITLDEFKRMFGKFGRITKSSIMSATRYARTFEIGFSTRYESCNARRGFHGKSMFGHRIEIHFRTESKKEMEEKEEYEEQYDYKKKETMEFNRDEYEEYEEKEEYEELEEKQYDYKKKETTEFNKDEYEEYEEKQGQDEKRGKQIEVKKEEFQRGYGSYGGRKKRKNWDHYNSNYYSPYYNNYPKKKKRDYNRWSSSRGWEKDSCRSHGYEKYKKSEGYSYYPPKREGGVETENLNGNNIKAIDRKREDGKEFLVDERGQRNIIIVNSTNINYTYNTNTNNIDNGKSIEGSIDNKFVETEEKKIIETKRGSDEIKTGKNDGMNDYPEPKWEESRALELVFTKKRGERIIKKKFGMFGDIESYEEFENRGVLIYKEIKSAQHALRKLKKGIGIKGSFVKLESLGTGKFYFFTPYKKELNDENEYRFTEQKKVKDKRRISSRTIDNESSDWNLKKKIKELRNKELLLSYQIKETRDLGSGSNLEAQLREALKNTREKIEGIEKNGNDHQGDEKKEEKPEILKNEERVEDEDDFECKICFERKLEFAFAGCGHMICNVCLSDWTKRNKKRNSEIPCPFCRKLTVRAIKLFY